MFEDVPEFLLVEVVVLDVDHGCFELLFVLNVHHGYLG